MKTKTLSYIALSTALLLSTTAAQADGSGELSMSDALGKISCPASGSKPVTLSIDRKKEDDEDGYEIEMMCGNDVYTALVPINTPHTPSYEKQNFFENLFDFDSKDDARLVANSKLSIADVVKFASKKVSGSITSIDVEVEDNHLYYKIEANNKGSEAEYLFNPNTKSLEEIDDDGDSDGEMDDDREDHSSLNNEDAPFIQRVIADLSGGNIKLVQNPKNIRCNSVVDCREKGQNLKTVMQVSGRDFEEALDYPSKDRKWDSIKKGYVLKASGSHE